MMGDDGLISIVFLAGFILVVLIISKIVKPIHKYKLKDPKKHYLKRKI
jgi:hypothetical protein